MEADQNGCFSGSAVEYDGRLYLFYTGVHYDIINPDDIHVCMNDAYTSAQMMIMSEGGFRLDVYVDPDMIEVYVNRGEYVISHGVCGLSDEIRADDGVQLRMHTVVEGENDEKI